MKTFIATAAIALSSVFAPLAAHAGTFNEFHGQRVEHRAPVAVRPGFRAPFVARPTAMRPVFVRHVGHEGFGREGWRYQQARHLESGRARWEIGRRF